MVPSRSRDTFGIGYFLYNFSDDLENAAEPLARYRDEEAVEIFYNLALTPWLRITADLQIIDPVTVASDTAVVTALRANVAF